MRARIWLSAWALLQGSGCFVDNPRNCANRSSSCGQSERCNLETQRCESLDCKVNASLCSAAEYCDGSTNRCVARHCGLDPTLCTTTQDCNQSTRQCETRQFVIGQPDAATNLNAAFGMSFPQSVLLVPDGAGKTKLIVGDVSNERVLIWNDVPTSNRAADVVLGAPDVNTLNGGSPYGGVNERSMTLPWSMTSDGVRLVVADQVLHRLLIWNSIPTAPSGSEPIPANQIWGQRDFEGNTPNAGSDMVNALGVNFPGVFLSAENSRFYVADRLNFRVLVFASGVPASPQTSPGYVIGQDSFTANLQGITATNFRDPRSVASETTKVYVSDTSSHRIVVFPLVNATNPTALSSFGQGGSLTTATSNLGGISENSLSSPITLSIPVSNPRRLFVTDFGNNRVLRYTLPSTTADLVLGQPNFNVGVKNQGGAASAATMNQPAGVSSDGSRIAVADAANNRVLLWLSTPTSGQAADVVLGQPDGSSTQANNPPPSPPLPFVQPLAVESDGAHLAIADTGNNRVLLWSSLPKTATTMPDVVLGQMDLNGRAPNAGGISAKSLSGPQSVRFEGGRLIIADTGNNRVLIYDQIPTQTFVAADYVVGQMNFTTGTPRMPITVGLSQPADAVLSVGTLYVADSAYNRVLIYNAPLQPSATANLVLGQPSLGSIAANNLGQSAASLANPRVVRIHNGKLLVADRANHRVLIWNTLPTTNNQAASVVVGQTDFQSSYTRTDRTRLSLPRGVLVHNGRLYVSTQNRILYWNEVPTKDGQRADGVLGQSDFLSVFPNNPDLPPIQRLSAAAGMSAFEGQLFIADTLNNRVVARPIP